MWPSKNVSRLLQRYPHFMLVLANSVIIAFIMVMVESALRGLGYSYTKKPDSLVLSDTFHVNEQGLFVANPASETLKRSGIGINSDGFRSPEFEEVSPAGQQGVSMAILGDSFAWGATAIPISQSFSDILRTEGYKIHNLGIPGSGPVQYRKIAETYLARLKPDIVVVALYLGNDILAQEWEPPQGRPLYYVIENDGWVTPFDEKGNYIEDVETAYEYYHNKFGGIRRFMRETATGTLVVKMARTVMTRIYKRQVASDTEIPGALNPVGQDVSVRYAHTYKELGRIRSLAEQLGARYYTVVIPALGQGCLTSSDFSLEAQRSALREFQPVYIELSDHHYNDVADCHLNNEGHTVVARALMNLVKPSQSQF